MNKFPAGRIHGEWQHRLILHTGPIITCFIIVAIFKCWGGDHVSLVAPFQPDLSASKRFRLDLPPSYSDDVTVQ